MVFDTNVLVHAVDDDSEYQDACARFLNSWRNGQQPAYLTWGICYEFLRVVTHPRVLRLPWDAANERDFLGGLLTLRGFQMLVPRPGIKRCWPRPSQSIPTHGATWSMTCIRRC